MANGLKRRGSLLVWLDRDVAWLAPKAGKPGRPPAFSEWGGSADGPGEFGPVRASGKPSGTGFEGRTGGALPEECHPVLPDDQGALQSAAQANGRDGRQHPRDGVPGLAGPGLFRAWPTSERDGTVAPVGPRKPVGQSRPSFHRGGLRARSTSSWTAPTSSSRANEEGPWRQRRRESPVNEWLAGKHGTHRRRQCRQLHLAMDTGTGDIRAVEFASSRGGGSPVRPELPARIPEDGETGTVADRLPADAPSPIGLEPMAPRWETPSTAGDGSHALAPIRKTAACGRRTALLRWRATPSRGPPSGPAGRSVSGGPAATSGAGSRPGWGTSNPPANGSLRGTPAGRPPKSASVSFAAALGPMALAAHS